MRSLLPLLLVSVLFAAPSADAQQLFDFNGQALIPAGVGGELKMYSVVVDGGGAVETPLPLDFANFEYTIVVEGAILLVDGASQSYINGTISLYKDNGTPADFADATTFTDGTAILSGVFTSLSRTIFFVTSGVGSATGVVDWTGGTRLDEIHPLDRLGWAFLTGISGGASVQPGYDETWDGKVEPLEPIVDIEPDSVGGIKSRY